MKPLKYILLLTILLLSTQAYAVVLHGGKVDKSGNGSYYQWDDTDAVRGLLFDANQDFTLKSVKVYNQQGQAATRVFTLYDASGNVVASESVDVKDGEQKITLNMHVPKGKGYKLMADIHKGLYKNDHVAGYPYKIGNAVTITGSDIDTSHYYFFYDWEIDTKKDNSNILHGGKVDKSGNGSYYQWDDADAVRGLLFDADQDFTLKSVKVYNQQGQAATRVFTLYDASGNVVASESVDVKDGEQKITLNMHVPKGKGYKLMADIHKGLYKNDHVAGYPYKIGNAVTITGSDIDTSHYYFFYDWEVEIEKGHDDPTPTPTPAVKTKAYIPSLDFSKNDVYGNGQMVTVHTTNELENALVHAEPYTTIILANGNYKNVHIYVPAGKHDITLKAQHPHEASIFPRGFDDASAIIFGRANTKNEEIHHINFIDIDVDGRGNDGQFIKSEGGATYSVHHIYFEDMEFKNLKMGLYSGLHSHDWTVNRCNMHDSEISHMWYMMGWHQAVINSTFYNGSHDILAIRGYYPDGETHTYIYDGDNSCHGNIYVENRYGRKGFLGKDVWTHLISGNKFLAWKRADNQRWRSNNHIGIGYGLYGDPVCGAERTYLPPQNIFIVNNTFSNEGEHNSLITDGITVDAWGGIESGKLSSINNIVVKNNTFIKDKDSERFIKAGGNSGDVTPDISKIHTQDNH